MPKTVISVQYAVGTNPYTTDFNSELSINSRFVLPPDLNQVNASEIVTAIGGTFLTESVPCSDSGIGKPRKLIFIRKLGNTMSVPIPIRENMLDVAGAVKAILDGANADNPVVCIKLEGEEYGNLNDEFGVSYDGTTFATSHKSPASVGKQNFASGVISYQADANNPFGASVTHSIRSITESADNTFAAQISAAAAGCIGAFLNIQNCGNGRRNPRKHRRFILDFATKADPADTAEDAQSERIELPVAGGGALDILACGNSAASLTALYCLGYKGESYSRVHKLL